MVHWGERRFALEQLGLIFRNYFPHASSDHPLAICFGARHILAASFGQNL